MGRVELDEALAIERGSRLLHISDTPSQLYPELKRIVGLLKPDYIVHTGDLVDNLKLQLQPSLSARYEREFVALARILLDSSAQGIYLALGNHDDAAMVTRHAGRALVFPAGGRAKLGSLDIEFCHYAPGVDGRSEAPRADLYLYGHDLSRPGERVNGSLYLNGIESMHCIDLRSGSYADILYPLGTEAARLNQYRIRI